MIGPDGEQLGIIPLNDAQNMAIDKNLDLVLIAPQGNPPVCKMMDYGKYKFEQAKREKESRKNQKVINIKEIRMSLSIDDHDLETKVGHAIKFLKSGDKVKATIRFKGREVQHSSLGIKLLDKVAELIGENGTIEKRPKLEGRNMSMFISPKQG